jgi:hypothetical protein
METLDLRKQYKNLYAPSAKTAQLVEIPALKFVMIDGRIEEGRLPAESPNFVNAMQALYGITYTLKFTFRQRKDMPIDYPVMPSEGLWWVEDGKFDIRDASGWRWTLMILQPDFIDEGSFAEALQQMRKKKGDQPGFDLLRLETFCEGPCVQIMHIGPYSTEPDTITRLYAYAATQGRSLRGKHHEIYVGNPLRSAPEKLKTILRQPVSAG